MPGQREMPMRLIAITHPDATSSKPRPLSEGGRLQAFQAARRIRELEGSKVSLATALSSPAFRCLETALLVTRELEATAKEKGNFDGNIHDVLELYAGSADLDAALDTIKSNEGTEKGAVLLSVHADLANMLKYGIKKDCINDSDGRLWFIHKPVIAGFDYAAGGVTEIRYIEALYSGSWQNCASATN